MKKLFSVLLFIVLVAGLVLGGCAAPAPAPAPTPAPAPAPAPTPAASAAPSEVIDIFCHVLPPKYVDTLKAQMPPDNFFQQIFKAYPKLWDNEARFKDYVPGYKQLISLMIPPIEAIWDSQKAPAMAAMANDGMAQLVKENPDKFIGAIGCLPMNNVDAALKEMDSCINGLGFKAIQIHTPINDKPLDSPEFIPIYEKALSLGVPILIHPWRDPTYPDYRTEKSSKFLAFLMWQWDGEETIAQCRLVYSGILEKYPNLTWIVHHGGSMVPFLQRISIPGQPLLFTLGDPKIYAELTKPPIFYYKKFYPDVTSMPDPAVIDASTKFYTVGHMLFATDYPFGMPADYIRLVQGMKISDADKAKIFSGNAKELFKLP